MRRWAWDEPETTEHPAVEPSHSGVRSPRRSTAPIVHGHGGGFIGSLPADAVAVDFQPIVDLETGTTVAYEVLPGLRIDGVVDVAALLAYAASEGTHGAIGRAIRTLAMREALGKVLYIPVHGIELQESFIVQPDDPLFTHEAGVRLQLAYPALSGVARQVFAELRSRCGAELVIDDYGAGAATLKNLIELQPFAVKLDRELIAGLDRNQRKQTAVRGTVEICRALDAHVIAKGVDCEAEALAVRACGVRYAQGYIVGDPSPLPAISIWPPSG